MTCTNYMKSGFQLPFAKRYGNITTLICFHIAHSCFCMIAAELSNCGRHQRVSRAWSVCRKSWLLPLSNLYLIGRLYLRVKTDCVQVPKYINSHLVHFSLSSTKLSSLYYGLSHICLVAVFFLYPYYILIINIYHSPQWGRE